MHSDEAMGRYGFQTSSFLQDHCCTYDDTTWTGSVLLDQLAKNTPKYADFHVKLWIKLDVCFCNFGKIRSRGHRSKSRLQNKYDQKRGQHMHNPVKFYSSSYKLILIFLSYLITRDAYHHIQRSHWPRLDFDCICSVVTRSRTSSGVTLCQTQKLYIVLDRDHLLTNCRLLVWMQYNTIITIHYMYVCLHIFGLF